MEHCFFLFGLQDISGSSGSKESAGESGTMEIRPVLADFFNTTADLNASVHHIPRSQDALAHNLAKKASSTRASPSCSFLCSKDSRCNINMALKAISFPLGKLLSVHCLGC